MFERPRMSLSKPCQSIQFAALEPRSASQLGQSLGHVHGGQELPLTTSVVKCDVSTGQKKPESLDRMTFEERVQWVLDNRPHLRKSRRHWARLAGLSDKTLNQAVLRSRTAEDNSPSMSVDSSQKLAETAHVDRRWLEAGIGSPDQTRAGLEHLDSHRMRVKAAEMLQKADGMDPREAWWLMRDLEPPEEHVTWEAFYLAARERISRESTHKPEVTPEKAAEAVARLRKR